MAAGRGSQFTFPRGGRAKASASHAHSSGEDGAARHPPHPVLLPVSSPRRAYNLEQPHPRADAVGEKGRCCKRELLPLPIASACGCDHCKLRTRQGEFARERAGVRVMPDDDVGKCGCALFWLERRCFSCYGRANSSRGRPSARTRSLIREAASRRMRQKKPRAS